MTAPGLLDKFLARRGYAAQIAPGPKPAGQSDNLFQPIARGHRMHGRFDDRSRDWAPALNPAAIRAALGLVAIAILLGAVFSTALLIGTG